MGIFGSKRNEVSAQRNLSKSQKRLVKGAQPYIKRYIKKTTPGGVALPKTPLNEPQNVLQKAGQTQALNAVGAQKNLATSAAGAATGILNADPTTAGKSVVPDWQDPASGATDFLLNKVLYPESNPALRGAIDAATRPIADNLVESALPAVRSGAYTSGGYGGSRQGIAEGLGIGKAATAIGDTAAGVANEGYKSGLGAMTSAYGNLLNADVSAYGAKTNALTDLYSTNVNAKLNALGLTPQIQAAQLSPALTTSGVGDVQQAAAQKLRDEEVYRKLYKQIAPLQSAQSLIALSGATPGGGTTTTGATPQSSPISNILGGASLGAALLPGLGPLGIAAGAVGGGALGLA